MSRFLRPVILAAALLAPLPLAAVQPEEVLADPLLELRAREISKDVRCLVCRNESIDDSTSDLAKDLRLLVRERLVAGDSDSEVIDYLVDRFGEYVLLRPLTTGANAVLWAAGPVMAIVALGSALLYLRSRREKAGAAPEAGLSEDEQRRLREIMGDGPKS